MISLGGMGAFGMNLTCYCVGDQYIVVDVGTQVGPYANLGISSAFPNVDAFFSHMGGPPLAYFITHGHEDHIGALPHVFPYHQAPMYSPPWSAKLIALKIDQKVLNPHLRVVHAGESIECRPFTVNYIHVNHSIPDACALLIEAQGVKIFHTGDFKFDRHPVGTKAMNQRALKALGDRHIDVLACDSTGSFSTGMCPSESSVVKPIETLIRNAQARTFITTFSSNFYRLQSIVEICQRQNKKLLIAGRGLKQSFEIAESLGIFKGSSAIIDESQARGVKKNRLVVLLSGSQCEPRSAVYRLAYKAHNFLQADEGDQIIFSSRMIPGNEMRIFEVVDRFKRLGINVISSKENPGVHVSGHAYMGDIELLTRLLRPKTFVPIHGSFGHMQQNGESIVRKKLSRMTLIESGDEIEISKNGVEVTGDFPLENRFIDDNSPTFFSYEVLRQRRRLGEQGLVWLTGVFSLRTNSWIDIDLNFMGVALPYYKDWTKLREQLIDGIKNDTQSFLENKEISEAKIQDFAQAYIRRRLFTQHFRNPTIMVRVFCIEPVS